MDIIQFWIQLAWLSTEAALVALLLLVIYDLRPWFGHSLFYVVLGGFQYLQTVLATTLFVEVIPGLAVSPGSAVLFSGTVFAVILVYIRENLEEARRLIYGLVFANLAIIGISLLFGIHASTNQVLGGASNWNVDVLRNALTLMFGTLILYLDFLLGVLLYEALGRMTRVVFLRVFLTLCGVLVFDTLLFSFVIGGADGWSERFAAGVISKGPAAFIFAAILTMYLSRFSNRGVLAAVTPEPLKDVLRSLTYRQRYEALRIQMRQDKLTGVFNRAFFDEILESRIKEVRRNSSGLGLLMIDLDFFKSINDQHGHPVGDRVLAEVGRLMKRTVREADFVCRYGGEEFGVVVPGASEGSALAVAEKILNAIRNLNPEMCGLPPDHFLTATIGVATCPVDATSADKLIRIADRRLYEGKRSGRNQVIDASGMEKLSESA